MAWKELLQQQEGNENRQAEKDGGASRERNGLIGRICGEAEAEPAEPAAPAEQAAEETRQILSDGYERRTPVQTYQTAPDFMRKRIRKAVLAVVALGLIVLLILALMKSGLVRLN